MILKLSRVRENDTSLLGTDSTTQARKRYRAATDPPIFVDGYVTSEQDVEMAEATLRLPCMADRKGMNAQDPLSSVHHYLICAYVLLPGIFGLRMCLRCPHCNVDLHDPMRQHRDVISCQDLLGRNTKPMGGYGGLAEGMAVATEFQSDATPHGHGFMSLANAYQHKSLQDIAELIENNVTGLSTQDVIDRITAFVEHMERCDHLNHQQHEADLPQLEEDFKRNNDRPGTNIFLSARARSFYEAPSGPSLWDDSSVADNTHVEEDVRLDAQRFKKEYEADVQIHLQPSAASLASREQIGRA